MGLGTYFTGIGREAKDIPAAIGTYVKGVVPQRFNAFVEGASPYRPGGQMGNLGGVRLRNSINAKENLSRQFGDLGAAIKYGRKETTSSDVLKGSNYIQGTKRYTDKYNIDNGPSQRR